jgi:glycosyltransferase involved in cell wall biosynthesis
MKLLIAIPAYNEELSIKSVILDVQAELPTAEILVVNDGSIDRTSEVAFAEGVRVINLPFNVGVGGAIRVAYKFAHLNKFTHVLQIDADGQHIAAEAAKLIAIAENDSIVIGTRFSNRDSTYKVGFARRAAMRILANVIGWISGTKLTDVTSGFRIASGSAIKLFAREYPRDYLGDTVESLIIAHRAGIKIIETPVEMEYRKEGAPSQTLIKSLWYLIRALLVISLSLLKTKSKF